VIGRARKAPGPLHRSLLWLLMMMLVLVLIEGLGAAVFWLVVVPEVGFLVWDPDINKARRAWGADWSVKDQELVWPTDPTAPPRDRTGAKLNPEFPDPGRACASAYGDSFVWGDDIPLADGWIEQLSLRMGCRVSNYGVSGYGTDQAYLRFRRTTSDDAAVALLGIFPENIMRNVNQYRGFMGMSWGPLALKGRFFLNAAGHLEWTPRPQLGPELFLALHRAPAQVVPREHFLPDTHDGPVTLQLPITWTLVRMALTPRLREALIGRPVWSDFYAPDHASGALALTIALAEAFAQEAERRGKRALIIVLPSASSFRGQAVYGEFEYTALLNGLANKHIEVLDLGAALLDALGRRSYCTLYSDASGCKGHYGRDGGGLVAEVVGRELEGRGWVRRGALR
jgi:hypothetical protein